MSQALHPSGVPVPAAPVSRLSFRTVLLVLGGLAFAAGFAVTDGEAARKAVQAAGPELARVLQLMALLKLTFVAAAFWLTDWRLRQPLSPALAAGYLGATVAMAAGPGLIWGMAHLVAGAVLLHGGLLAMLVLSCMDGGMWRWTTGRRTA